MSRLSIAILVLIVLGFIMTVKRDEPQYPGTPPTVGTAQTPKATDGAADKNKKAGTPLKAGPTVAALPPKAQPATPPVVPGVAPTPPVAPPVVTPQAAVNPPVTPQKVDDKTAAKAPGGLTEQTVPGNTPTSATPSTGIIEGGENLGRETQKELSRLGCFTGNVTERWSKEGRAAIKRFNVASRYAWDDWPKPELLASLKRYPDNYCKKCRGGSGSEECEKAGTEADKETAPTVRMETPPANNPVIAVIPPSTAVTPTPPAATPTQPTEAAKVAPATPATPNLNITPPPPATANELKEQNGVKSASTTEGTPDDNASPYLPPSSKPQGGDDDNENADTGEGKKPKNVRRRPVRDEAEEPIRRSTPRRSRPVAEEPKPKPRVVYRPVERNYTPAPRRYYGGGGGGSWEMRPQGVGR